MSTGWHWKWSAPYESHGYTVKIGVVDRAGV